MSFSDSFTEASDTNLESHTPDTGTAWTRQDGAAGGAVVFSSSGNLRCQTTTATSYASDDQGADARVWFKAKAFSTTTANSLCGPRVVDASNIVGWRIFGTGSLGRRLTKKVAGTLTDLITSQGVSDEWIKVEAEGTTIRLYEAGTGATVGTWTQIGTDQTVSDFSTEASQGIVIANNSATDWIDEYNTEAISSGGTAVTATTDALVISEQNATVNAQKNVTATTDALVLTEQNATVTIQNDIAVVATTDALVITEQPATVTIATGIVANATTDALIITEQNATVNAQVNVTATTDALILTEQNATVTIQNDIAVVATTDALVITEQNATVNAQTNIIATTDSIILTENQAVVTANVPINVIATTDSLVLSEFNASVVLGNLPVIGAEKLPIFKTFDWRAEVNRLEPKKPPHVTYEFTGGTRFLEQDDYDPYNR